MTYDETPERGLNPVAEILPGEYEPRKEVFRLHNRRKFNLQVVRELTEAQH